MLYLLLILWAYCAIVLVLVAAEVDATNGRTKRRTPFSKLLILAVVALVAWPFLVSYAYQDWNTK